MKVPLITAVALAISFLIAGVVSMWRSYSTISAFERVDAIALGNEMVQYTTRTGIRYRPETTFRYLVEGAAYATPYSIPRSFADYREAKAVLDRYAPGMRHEIYFNRKDPSDILLEVDKSPRFFAWPLAMLASSVLLGAVCLITFINLGRKQCQNCAASVTQYLRYCYSCGHKLPRKLKGVT